MDNDEYEQLITDAIRQYSKSKGNPKKLFKEARDHLDQYQIFLESTMAPESRKNWLESQRQKLRKAKEDKIVVTDEVKVKDILELGRDIDKRLINIHKMEEQAIQASTLIRLELEKQIQALDGVYDENMDTGKKIRRAKKGLKTILKRAMLNKLTRCLAILVVLAVIGLIVVSILKDKGIIKI